MRLGMHVVKSMRAGVVLLALVSSPGPPAATLTERSAAVTPTDPHSHRGTVLPALPSVEGGGENVELVGHYAAPGAAYDVAVAGPHAYVTYGWSRQMHILDVSDPSNPTKLEQWTDPYYGALFDVAIAGNNAYVLNLDCVYVLDISNPARPVLVAVTGPDEPMYMALHDDYAYITSDESGLKVIDISDPTDPEQVGSYYPPGETTLGVAAAGHHVYLAAGADGLLVLDVSDPAHPTKVGTYEGPGTGRARQVVASGTYVYVAWYSGLHVVDASDPSHPTGVGVCGVSGTLHADHDLVYVADWGDGLHVVEVSDPAHPTEVGFYHTSGSAHQVTVAGGLAYVADGDEGLFILRVLRDKVTGSIPSTGGSLSSTSGDASLVFPSGAFTETVLLTYRHLWRDQNPGERAGIGHTFDLTAVYSDTGQTAQLVPGAAYTAAITYIASGPAIEDTLGLHWWDERTGQWSQQGISSSVNTDDNLVTAQVDRLSLFAVLGETQRVFLPLVLRHW